ANSHCAALAATAPELRDRHADGYTGPAMIAVGPIREGAAAPKAEPDQLAVDGGVDEVARGRDLRSRGAVRQVAAGIRRRRVELQRGQRKVVQVAHRCSSGPLRQPTGGRLECINSPSFIAKASRAIGRAPIEARCAVSCWQSISALPRCCNNATRAARQTFEASVARVNIDSPKNTSPSATP